jgi:hypothetical protein
VQNLDFKELHVVPGAFLPPRSPSLETDTLLSLADQIFIFGHGEWDVCEGGHWLDVMKNGWPIKKFAACSR